MSYVFKGLKPYDHQMKTIKFYLANKRCYNLSDLGTGKTAPSIWLADILLKAGHIKKVLVICPLSIMDTVWRNEILQLIPEAKVSIVHGTRDKRIERLAEDSSFFLTNTDAPRSYLNELLAAKFDLVIIDEVDSFGNATSQRSKACQIITSQAKSVIGLTGTPTADSPVTAFGICKVVNPDGLPCRHLTKWKSLTMYEIAQHIWIPSDNCERIVHEAMQPAIRFKLEMCGDIPDMVNKYVEFRMNPVQEKMHKQMKKEQLIELQDSEIIASNAAVKFSKLLQISGGCVYDSDGNTIVTSIKDRTDYIVHTQKQAGQVIVFVQFTHIIKEILKNIPRAKAIYGDVSPKARALTINEFKDGKFDILIAQPRVAAHGLNLQFCNHIIFWGPILGNSYYRQAIGRIRRSGQKRVQVVINMVSSIEERKIYAKLETKEVSSRFLLGLYEDIKNER